MKPIIRIERLHFTYQTEGRTPLQALAGVDLTIHAGEYVAILGHNGSGKSTLAKHLNGLLLPSSGDVWVKDWNTKERAHLRNVRSTVGMVFQHPDNQIVATIVEEDVAFGPENLGVPHSELVNRVAWALGQVEMTDFRLRAPHLLSGGQKQRVCIAGVLAMQPAVLVLDEATAMLDPVGRKEVLAVAHKLNRERGVTVVAITHFMREAVQADRIVVMAKGRIAMQGTPHEIFAQTDRLRELQLDVPYVTELAIALHQRYPEFPANLLSAAEVVGAVKRQVEQRGAQPNVQAPAQEMAAPAQELSGASSPPLIAIRDLVHFYMRGTPLEVKALEDIDIEVRRGEIVGIIGHTGSGKSTAVQHFNGLLRPHGGSVTVMGQDLSSAAVDVRSIRRQVGLVFQFAEAQLFEQYVGDDVAFGPRNLGLNRDEVRARVREAMEAVGLGFEEFKDRFTFGLSGGQMRRVALAGVLALRPQVLVLDEPTAGLDPQGRKQLLRHILDLHRHGITLVIISHNMEELAAICNRLYVIAHGRTVMAGSPAVIFGQSVALHEMNLDVPDVTSVVDALIAEDLLPAGTVAYTLEQAVEAVSQVLGEPQPQ